MEKEQNTFCIPAPASPFRFATLWHSCFHSFICDFCNLLKSSASAAANLCHLAAESNQGGAECALWLAIKWSSALRALYENHRNHRCSWYSNKQINKIAKFIWFINIQINFYVPKAARESRRVPCCLPARLNWPGMTCTYPVHELWVTNLCCCSYPPPPLYHF